jgi:hypothetical protein
MRSISVVLVARAGRFGVWDTYDPRLCGRWSHEGTSADDDGSGSGTQCSACSGHGRIVRTLGRGVMSSGAAWREYLGMTRPSISATECLSDAFATRIRTTRLGVMLPFPATDTPPAYDLWR